jgi:hypothetical protein
MKERIYPGVKGKDNDSSFDSDMELLDLKTKPM